MLNDIYNLYLDYQQTELDSQNNRIVTPNIFVKTIAFIQSLFVKFRNCCRNRSFVNNWHWGTPHDRTLI